MSAAHTSQHGDPVFEAKTLDDARDEAGSPCIATVAEHDGAPRTDGLPTAAVSCDRGIETAARVRELEIEVAHLETALVSQRQIGVSIGLLAQRFDCTTDQAWRVLVRLSQNTNIKVREVARVLRDAYNGDALVEDAQLLRQLGEHLPASGWPGLSRDSDP